VLKSNSLNIGLIYKVFGMRKIVNLSNYINRFYGLSLVPRIHFIPIIA